MYSKFLLIFSLVFVFCLNTNIANTQESAGTFRDPEVSSKVSKIQSAARDSGLQDSILAATNELQNAKTDAAKTSATKKLSELLATDYEARLSDYQVHLDELDRKLGEMKARLIRKRNAKADMIELRIKVLQAEEVDLGWPSHVSAMDVQHVHDSTATAAATENSTLDKRVAQILAEHRVKWKKLGASGATTVEKIESLRDETLAKLPPFSSLQPVHVSQIKSAGLLQSGPGRDEAIREMENHVDDKTVSGAMARFLLFDLAVEYPLFGYPEGETDADRLEKRRACLASLLEHPKLESLFESDQRLRFFSILTQMSSPQTWNDFRSRILDVQTYMVQSRQLSFNSELRDCFDVMHATFGKDQPELVTEIRQQLVEYGMRQLEMLEGDGSAVYDDEEFLKFYTEALKGQVAYLESVSESGTLIGTQAKPLDFLWASSGVIRKWDDLRGKVSVLYFSTPSCGPCVKSVPKLIRVNEQLASHINFIGITSQQGVVPLKRGVIECPDDVGKECELIKEYIVDAEINWPIVFINESVFNASYGVRSIPHMVVLDSKGIVRDMLNPYAEKEADILKRINAVVK